MTLAARKLVQYLLDIGVVDAASVVDGDLMIVDTTRRHRNAKVLRQAAPGCFVKQAQSEQPLANQSLHREAVCGWLIAHDERFAALRRLVPRWLAYDHARSLLVSELLPEAENMAEHHLRLGRFPPELADLLGRELGLAHAGVSIPPANAPGLEVFPRAQPWILSIHQLAASQFERLSAGHMQVLALVRQYPEYKSVLDALRGQWSIDGLVHGDMKFENCLVLAAQPGQEEPALRIVDWELADFGDMYWDVGAVFQAYLSTWVLSMPEHDEASAERLVSHARYPLESLQPAIAAFWRAYSAVRPAPAGLTSAALLTRCVQYAAARMIQTSYEHVGQVPRVTMGALRMLQVSMNMLTRPADAIRDLLGMPEALQEAAA